MWNSLDACSRRPSLLVVRTLTEALTVLTWKVQVCMRCRYASELGLHVEVGPLIIATLVSPCALAALSHPTPPLRLYHFAAAKYNVHISKRGLVPVSPGLGQISTRNTSVKMCWNTSLPRRIANEDAHVARVPFFFFFFLILATFPSLLSRTSFVDARLRLQDPLIFQFFSSGMWNTSSIWISRIN